MYYRISTKDNFTPLRRIGNICFIKKKLLWVNLIKKIGRIIGVGVLVVAQWKLI